MDDTREKELRLNGYIVESNLNVAKSVMGILPLLLKQKSNSRRKIRLTFFIVICNVSSAAFNSFCTKLMR